MVVSSTHGGIFCRCYVVEYFFAALYAAKGPRQIVFDYAAVADSSDLFDVDSVELLSGFQGHRFGKNSHGGVINIKTRRPNESHRSKLYASYATFNTQNYRVLADGPTGENSYYYFGMNRSESDGFADNTNLLGNDATSKSWNGRLGFESNFQTNCAKASSFTY